MKKPTPKYDPFSWHEILDRAAILADQWDRLIESDKEEELKAVLHLKEQACHIGDCLGDFYRAVGNHIADREGTTR